jgi:hypothetical protein
VCLIVDNSVRDRVFFKSDDNDFRDLHSCLKGNVRPVVKIIYGGQLRREYLQRKDMMEQLAALDRKGQAKIIRDAEVDKETTVVKASRLCRSNDEHIIALARVARVRLLAAGDNSLKRDFKNKALIDDPRGKVYDRRSHDALLREFCSSSSLNRAKKRRR